VPIYEYHCIPCGKEFEKLVFGQTPSAPVACPRCAGARVTRRLSVFGVKTASVVATAGEGSGGGGGGCCGGGCGCR
jgi:putative FmdB family regulatory protein